LPDNLIETAASVVTAGWYGAAVAVTIATGSFAALWVLRSLVRRHHSRMSLTDGTEILEIPLKIASRTTLPFLLVVAAYIGFTVYGVTDATAVVLLRLLTIALFWQAGLWISTLLVTWLDRRAASRTDDKAIAGSIGIIRFIARVAVWAMVLLLTLDNLGIDITALVAGLGIGGIAVALALQNVLGDLFASLSIALDQPFALGDFVVAGDHMGTVEYIGIKSTRLRSLSGEQIVMPNADLLSSRLRNYGRMRERRVVFTLGVTYETPRAKLQKIPGLLRDIVQAQDDARFDRAHFAKYGAYSLDFEIVFHVLSADYGRYMDVQQQINFEIHEAFEALGVEFAYPTQTLRLSGDAVSATDARAAVA
jgi:small-conductance mechanosensitive channel